MVGIPCESDDPFVHEQVHDPLHTLTGHAHSPGDLRDGSHRFGHGSDDLPSSLRLPQWRRQRCAMTEQRAVEAEYFKHEIPERCPSSTVSQRAAPPRLSFLVSTCRIMTS